MGCFSYICKECGEPVNSDSLSGEWTHLFLLKDGLIYEHMYGPYDSYGRCFMDGNLSDSFEWEADWEYVVELHLNKNKKDGIAAVHAACFNGAEDVPSISSKDDPNQGWGVYGDKHIFEDFGVPFHTTDHQMVDVIPRDPAWYNNEV